MKTRIKQNMQEYFCAECKKYLYTEYIKLNKAYCRHLQNSPGILCSECNNKYYLRIRHEERKNVGVKDKLKELTRQLKEFRVVKSNRR